MNYDHQYISKTNKALKWYRNVQDNGMSWKLTPPTVSELYPNMCIDSGQWNIKKQHSSKIDTANFDFLPRVKIN